jgi:1,3-beta-glucan synthase
MSGYPAQQQHHDYDDGYGQSGQNGQNGHPAANTDSYYQDDQHQYYDNNGYDAPGGHQQPNAAEGYYDEA